MQKSILILALLMTINTIQATEKKPNKLLSTQEDERTRNITLGIGILKPGINTSGYDLNNTKFTTKGGRPIFLKFEQRTGKKSLGFNLAFENQKIAASVKDTNSNVSNKYFEDEIEYTGFSALFRFNKYFNENENFQPYIGLGLGVKYKKYKDLKTDYNPVTRKNSASFGLDFTLGARIKLIDKLYFYSEIGVAKSFIQGGISYSF